MLSSIRNLYQSPYNRQHPFFAFRRWVFWKYLRATKKSNVKYHLWDDRYLYLNHDSFQSMWIMYNYIVDWEEFNLIKAYLQPNDTVFDIGANMGFYTVWMSKFIKPGGNIHCFEPDQRNYQRLTANIAMNNTGNIIRPNNCALSEQAGELNFTIGLDGENHIAIDGNAKIITVKADTLDNYATQNRIGNIAYAKIDVEGFELSVLKGGSRLLNEKRIDILQLEINQQVKNSGTTVNDLLDYLEVHGYSLWHYESNANKLTKVEYTPERENYFAIADINKITQRLRK